MVNGGVAWARLVQSLTDAARERAGLDHEGLISGALALRGPRCALRIEVAALARLAHVAAGTTGRRHVLAVFLALVLLRPLPAALVLVTTRCERALWRRWVGARITSWTSQCTRSATARIAEPARLSAAFVHKRAVGAALAGRSPAHTLYRVRFIVGARNAESEQRYAQHPVTPTLSSRSFHVAMKTGPAC